jgi:quinol monooxygenase YgiN
VRSPSKDVSVIQATIRIVSSDELRGEVLEVLRCLKGPTEVQRGCRGCLIVQDIDDRNALTCIEHWEDLEDLKDHVQSERFRRLLPYIEMSVEPPEVEVEALQRIHGIEFLEETLSHE